LFNAIDILKQGKKRPVSILPHSSGPIDQIWSERSFIEMYLPDIPGGALPYCSAGV
jgi:hypothetical protein